MRANQFTKQLQQLDEVAMNPNSLRQLASKIPGAKAGMEFEMYVPNANAGEESDGDMEENYDDSPRTRSIDNICEFFEDGDYNGRQDIRRLREMLQEQYSEYSSEYLDEKWQQDGREELRTYMLDNGDIDRDDIIEEATEEIKEANPELPDDSEDFGNLVSARADEIINEKVDEEWTYEGRTYARAREDWDSSNDWPDEDDWLRYAGYSHMDDISNDRDFEITWPHWTSSGGGELNVEDVAGQFEQAIGRNVNFSDRYHGGTRDETSYVVEPDGSLHDKRDNDDAGLEFISPPLPISEMLSDLDKVKAWADENNCYTNKSTGLHINVSVPGITEESLDYVKLAILLGDKYVLEQFGRASNTYCRSSLDLVKQNAASRPEDALKIMDTMRRGLNTMAAKAIHSGATAKFVSINNKEGYIEFRSPGGDWLGTNFDKIEATLLRTVVAVDAATNPQKYRKEYLTKLYKILNVKGENDPIAYFAKYAAGEMPKAALKSFIKQLQTTRATAKAAPPAPEKAAASVRQSQPGDRGWNLFDDLGNLVDTFTAATQGEANALAQAWLRTNWREASNGPYEVVPAGAN
jgi:hypothetical protein